MSTKPGRTVRRIADGCARLLFRTLVGEGFSRQRVRLLRFRGFDVALSARCVASVRIAAPTVTIGEDAYIGHEVRIYGGKGSYVTIAPRVDIGPSVLILAGTHRIGPPDRRAGVGMGTRVTIEEGAWVGGGAVIVGDCRIGRGAMVAAGAVVRNDVEPNAIYYGPDRSTKMLDS